MKQSWIIGTRGSRLATTQTQAVQIAMTSHELHSTRKIIKSDGDIHQHTPLYKMGVRGVFTHSLDAALLEGKIDLAVHSLKDVPTQLAEGLVLAAVLPRGPVHDLLILQKGNTELPQSPNSSIATGSLRRKAQWLNRFPTHNIYPIRGNIETRLHTLGQSLWDGTILAEAALHRLHLLDHFPHIRLKWMIPAPAQGVVGIVCRKENVALRAQLTLLNHEPTFQAITLERAFMARLEAGCTAPLGAIAHIHPLTKTLTAVLLSLDGQVKISKTWQSDDPDLVKLGEKWAEEMLSSGGKEIMEEIRLQQF